MQTDINPGQYNKYKYMLKRSKRIFRGCICIMETLRREKYHNEK